MAEWNVDSLYEAGAYALETPEKGNFKILKQAANKFLKSIQEEYQKIEQIQRFLGNNRNGLASAISDINTKLMKDSEVVKKLVSEQTLFEGALNNFLGRKIFLSYVFQNGEVAFYDEINEAKLYEENAVGSEGRGRVYHTKIAQTQNDLPIKLRQRAINAITNKKQVFSEAIRRYNKPAGQGQGKMVYKIYFGEKTFYWRTTFDPVPCLDWSGEIPDRGRIAESYINYVFNEADEGILYQYNKGHKDLNFENQLKHLSETIEGRKDNGKFDWIAGIVQGDVQVKSLPEIQFAVKSFDFSSARIAPTIRFAYNINQAPYLDIKTIQSNLKTFSRGISRKSKAAKVIKGAKQKCIQDVQKEANQLNLT